jgi:hypothetical protein
MTIPESKEQLQHLVIRYLYGDLSGQEIAQFDAELKSNSRLREVLEAEQRFDSAMPIGTQPQIDADRIAGNRWLLRQNLQRENRTRFSLSHWLEELSNRRMTLMFQGAAMAATFVLGILIATPAAVENPGQGSQQLLAAVSSPLEFIGDEDYEIFQFKVNNYDASTGDIDLSFSLASETRLTGNVADQNINSLMAVALQGVIDSGSRLDTIDALQGVISGNRVSQALVHVLMNDQNPGVRYQAVLSLVELANQDHVREALRYALSEDVNQGVRVEAFQALVNYPDDETLSLFRQKMEVDSNEYIRAQARSIVEEFDNGPIIL